MPLMGAKARKKILITRDPLKRKGAFLINGTRLAVTDIMYAIWRGDVEYLELEMDLKEIISAIKEWLEKTLREEKPAFLLNCIRQLDTDRECAIKLARIVESKEAHLRHKELGKLHELLLLKSEPKKKSKEYKWLMRIKELFPDSPMEGLEQYMFETLDVIKRLRKEMEEHNIENTDKCLPT